MTSSKDSSANKSEQSSEQGDQRLTADDRYQLPRTISPIGIFYGRGAPDPRKFDQDEERAPSDEHKGSRAVPVQRKTRAPIGTPVTRSLISLGVTIGCGLFYVLTMHLPLNPQIPEFWVLLVWLCLVYTACLLFLRGTKQKR